MVYIFRLILICIPLFGAVAATAEVQRIDRELQATVVTEPAVAEPEIVLALNTLLPVLAATDAIDETELQVSPLSSVATSASKGLPICLALVLLVALVRHRV